MMHTILAQTVLFARYTWYILHRLGTTTDWDERIPIDIKKMASLTVYAFFFEGQHAMPQYQFSEHPQVVHYLIGLTDAGQEFHASMIFLVSVMPDSSINRVQLLLSDPKTNKSDRSIPFHELNGLNELLVHVNSIITFLDSKGFKIPRKNIHLFTDSEVVLIWIRVL